MRWFQKEPKDYDMSLPSDKTSQDSDAVAAAAALGPDRPVRRDSFLHNSGTFLYVDEIDPEDEELVRSMSCCYPLRLYFRECHSRPTAAVEYFAAVIFLLGAACVGVILGRGLPLAQEEQRDRFVGLAEDLRHEVELTLHDYTQSGLWIHQSSIAAKERHNVSDETESLVRFQFHDLYEYLLHADLHALMVGYSLNISRAERAAFEEKTRISLLQDFPNVTYDGFKGYEGVAGEDNYTLVRRSEQPFYFPLHLQEPLSSTVDFDLWSLSSVRDAIEVAMTTWNPSVSKRLCRVNDPSGILALDHRDYAVIFVNPGVPLSTDNLQAPRGLSLIVASMREIVDNIAHHFAISTPANMYVFDESDATEGEDFSFLGAARFSPIDDERGVSHNTHIRLGSRSGGKKHVVHSDGDDRDRNVLEEHGEIESEHEVQHHGTEDPVKTARDYFLKDQPGGGENGVVHESVAFSEFEILDAVNYTELKSSEPTFIDEYTLQVTSRTWRVVVTGSRNDFRPDYSFVIGGAVILMTICAGLTLWLFSHHRRSLKIADMQAQANAEKSQLMVQNARSTARREREMNDFIAHEVRNPLAAALSACSFVSAEIQESQMPKEKQNAVQEDISVIDSSLQFINDLLRNMLDMHRANSNQLKLKPTLTSVRNDILDPVAAMLYRRNDNFTVDVSCEPADLVVMADKLRLKQIVLNLGRNAVKFVVRGFVKLRAEIKNGKVCLYVEDSGPGIPKEKRNKLFNKFQDSLDSLHQGTGIGLAVCRKLIDLMGGDITLDETYESGISGCPGARFIINLNTPAVRDFELDNPVEEIRNSTSVRDGQSPKGFLRPQEENSNKDKLPDHLQILFVDDDMLLRKLFVRSVKRVAPEWTVQEASNGETALQMAKDQQYDIIFMDQYMASVDKQMLGTEAVRALRAQGVDSVICGLSANDMEKPFRKAGADAFCIKPFPCIPAPLREALIGILESRDRGSSNGFVSDTEGEVSEEFVVEQSLQPKEERSSPQQSWQPQPKEAEAAPSEQKPLFQSANALQQKGNVPTSTNKPLFQLPQGQPSEPLCEEGKVRESANKPLFQFLPLPQEAQGQSKDPIHEEEKVAESSNKPLFQILPLPQSSQGQAQSNANKPLFQLTTLPQVPQDQSLDSLLEEGQAPPSKDNKPLFQLPSSPQDCLDVAPIPEHRPLGQTTMT